MNNEMIEVKWKLSIGLARCRIEDSIEVEADCTDDEIDEMVREAAMERVEWSWERES